MSDATGTSVDDGLWAVVANNLTKHDTWAVDCRDICFAVRQWMKADAMTDRTPPMVCRCVDECSGDPLGSYCQGLPSHASSNRVADHEFVFTQEMGGREWAICSCGWCSPDVIGEPAAHALWWEHLEAVDAKQRLKERSADPDACFHATRNRVQLPHPTPPEPDCAVCGKPIRWCLDMHSYTTGYPHELAHAHCVWTKEAFHREEREAQE